MISADRQVLSVSQLNGQVRQLLEALPLLWVEGEISNLSRPSSGHWYFTLKDANAQIRCAMFKNRNQGVRCNVKDGDKILLRAKVSLYEGRGDYQLIVEHLEPAGLGDLQQQFEQLKLRLSAEGLFDEQHKQELPYLPARIGVITSPTGAALRDVLHVLHQRMPYCEVLVIPVAVQGAGAAAQIAQAIQHANAQQGIDVIILGRGGGSLEDLWAFNEEIVARAIFASGIPIISAVGHETDITISDFVADVRAPTPSAAAALAVPERHELLSYVDALALNLQRLLQQYLTALQQRLRLAESRLQNPRRQLQLRQQHIDLLCMRLQKNLRQQLHQNAQRLQQQHHQLLQQSPLNRLALQKQHLKQLQARLERALLALLKRKQQQVQQSATLLHNLSPLPTLERGYSICLNEDGKVIRQIADIPEHARFRLRLKDGEAWVAQTPAVFRLI
ncbi:MAG: exodeoxyribonuclease large subunit [Pseudomonadota bacterium]|jgi:exodeoxyribonuclease VII large subunit